MWTVRLADDAVTISPRGNVVTVDTHDVVVVDKRAAPPGEVPATVTFGITWKGRGGRRRLAAEAPAFAGRFFRQARARGTFSGSEDGFAFASDALKRARSTFAELGTEQNGLFITLATRCPRCGVP
ncbi:MAG: hypothetical protein E6J68_16490 [Deltaproteobacteria bacterium]|nr:MAG: hypothetical protein E6J68_16490 [Deltaproteobacteria bacterium]